MTGKLESRYTCLGRECRGAPGRMALKVQIPAKGMGTAETPGIPSDQVRELLESLGVPLAPWDRIEKPAAECGCPACGRRLRLNPAPAASCSIRCPCGVAWWFTPAE